MIPNDTRISPWLPWHRGSRRSVSAAAALLLIGLAAQASEGEHREHAAHVHGEGTLDVAAAGGELVIELRVPAVNVVGFEHEAVTGEEHEAVEEALALFRRPAMLFRASAAARCEVADVTAVIAGMGHGRGEPHEEHAHEEHAHDEAQETGEHAHAGEGEAHSELRAEYRFHCQAPERLARLEVRVLEHLLDAEALAVRVVTPTVQSALELHRGDTHVELAP